MRAPRGHALRVTARRGTPHRTRAGPAPNRVARARTAPPPARSVPRVRARAAPALRRVPVPGPVRRECDRVRGPFRGCRPSSVPTYEAVRPPKGTFFLVARLFTRFASLARRRRLDRLQRGPWRADELRLERTEVLAARVCVSHRFGWSGPRTRPEVDAPV